MATSIDAPPTTAAAAQAAPIGARRDRRARGGGRLKKRGGKWLIWLALAAAVAIAGWRLSKGRAEAPIEVSTASVQRGNVRDFVTSIAAGRVSARQEATLRAEIAGKVQKLRHRRGDRVIGGEPLIAYDAAELNDRLRVAQAAVALARAQARQADQSAANVEVNLARARRLRASGAIALAELEDLEGQSKAMERGADAARAGVSQALANVDLARAALAKAVVVAPFSGVVLTVHVEEGETTAPGAPLLELADVSELHVDGEIDEADLGRVKVGMPVDVSLDAFPGERVRGALEEIAPSVTRDLRGGRSIAIVVRLPRDDRLRVGMSADLDIIVEVRESTLFVPPNAILGRGAERSAYVVQGGVAHKRAVDVGVSTWEAVEIRSGLSEGDEVVASLSTVELADGARVQLKPRGK
jgi:HlyD family secretion protein